MALGSQLFGVVFGSQWEMAGGFGSWIAVWSAIALVSSPISTIYLVAGRQRTGLVFSVLDASAKSLALVVGGWLGGATVAVNAFAITAAGSYVAFHMWNIGLVKLSLWQWLRSYLRELAISALVVTGLFALRGRIPVIPLWGMSTTILAVAYWPRACRLVLNQMESA